MKVIHWLERTVSPGKIVCVGRNYVEHIHELQNEVPQELVLFLKPNSAIDEELWVPAERCRFEAEICFLLEGGRPAAVGVGLDLTLVEVQSRLKSKGLPWEKAKAFDGAAVFSPFVPFDADNLRGLEVRLSINDSERQRGGVVQMIHPPEAILAEVARHFSLDDHDIIMTGTPKGVGDLRAGDRFAGAIWQEEQLLVSQRWEAKTRPAPSPQEK